MGRIGLPNDLSMVRTLITSGGANTAAYVTMLAAPGAGQRYRLWGWTFTTRQVTQTPSRAYGLIGYGSPISSGVSDLAIAGFGSAPIVTFAGGLPLAVNTALVGGVASDIASLATAFTAWYTTESV